MFFKACGTATARHHIGGRLLFFLSLRNTVSINASTLAVAVAERRCRVFGLPVGLSVRLSHSCEHNISGTP